MDIILLRELRDGSLSGYDLIGLIHDKFGVLFSSGTIYSILYSLERDGLVAGIQQKRKRVYAVTEKGEQNMGKIMRANEEIEHFLRKISLINAT